MKDPNHLALQILRASKPSRFEIFLQDFKEENLCGYIKTAT